MYIDNFGDAMHKRYCASIPSCIVVKVLNMPCEMFGFRNDYKSFKTANVGKMLKVSNSKDVESVPRYLEVKRADLSVLLSR